MDTFLELDIFKHKGTYNISIRFPFNFVVKEKLKTLSGIKWSVSHKVFYIVFSLNNYERLIRLFKEHNWNYDEQNLNDFLRKEDKLYRFKKQHLKKIEAFKNWMEQQRYSVNTIKTYNSMLLTFFKYYYYKPTHEINEKDIIRFNHDLLINSNYSYNAQNQMISAIKLFFKKYHHMQISSEMIERPVRHKYLPVVLSSREVVKIINATGNLKHKVLLSMIYSAGLRIGEALSLRINDIDSERMLIRIFQAKGNKDRYVPLSEKIIFYLREYYKLYRPNNYLFEGKNGGKYSQSSARSVLRNALIKAGIKKRVTLHTLRHSYATHLLESGTDIRYIQELLGHNSPKTTMIYTHVSSNSIENIKSPFDKLEL